MAFTLIPALSVKIIVRLQEGAHTADAIAIDEGVSVRTVYRAIAALKADGAPIEGEAGVGYIMRKTRR